jgi:hypothetical protein
MGCCLRKQIQVAIAILSEVSKALMQMFSLVFFPLVPFAMSMVFMAWWIAVAVALYAMSPDGDNKMESLSFNGANITVFTHVANTDESNLWWYHLFGLLWTMQIIEGITIMTIAGAFCMWYWRDDKSSLGHTPVTHSFYRTMRYHIGTVIFGSLIIAIVQFVRAVLNYVEHKMKEAGEDSAVVKVVMCVLKCCLYCLEKCLKKLSKTAYIITAMKGESFCKACFEGLSLFFKNAGRVAAVSVCSVYIVVVGKLMIIAASTLIGYVWLDNLSTVQDPIAPTFLVAVMAYVITHVVLAIYDLGTDTILLCVIEDEDLNKSTGQFFAPPQISKLLEGAGKAKDEHKY